MSILYSRGSVLLVSAVAAANKQLTFKTVRGCAAIHTSALAWSNSKAKAGSKKSKPDNIQSKTDDIQPMADIKTPEVEIKMPKTDPRHQEFCESFLAALKEASTRPPEPLPVDKTTQAIDQQLAGALKELFTKYPVVVSPKLLERRQQLRDSYPELFKDITDKELDG
ncbi:hypothetical protein GGI19_004712 [Coemansia pectinata]|uniref:Uncharacterized protein n=1 Tax=Coemansia pectinata TaxID=1052879 RepID=A0A9W8GR60_9FUNG|nr:hypothetical protein GGI19_004712 [Coemansia pectinata]